MPASDAGMQNGDKILKINDEDITHITTLSDAVKAFNDAGEKVNLTVQRGDQILDLEIERFKT